MNRTARLAWLAAAAALGSTGCGGAEKVDPWEADLTYTHRLHIDGQHALAAKRYAALRKGATRPEDADEAGLLACEATRRADALQPAIACFEELGRSAHARPVRARALLHAAEIRFDQSGEVPAAVAGLWGLVEAAPDTSAGLRALTLLSRHGRRDPDTRRQVIDRMITAERARPAGELADNLLLRAAELLSETGREADDARAIGLLTRLQNAHPTSPALLRGLTLRAGLLAKSGQPADEARTLERIVGTLETSHIVASYIEPDHVRALERLVALYAGPLSNLERAERHAQRLLVAPHDHIRTFEWMASLARIQERRGKRAQATATWKALIAEAARRDADMADNDRRICREGPDQGTRTRCLQAVAAFKPLPVKEVALAREALAKLQPAAPGGTP